MSKSNFGKTIVHSISEQFKTTEQWTNIEADVALLCTEFPIEDDKTLPIIQKLFEIKEFLKKTYPEDKLTFIDDEIDRIRSLYPLGTIKEPAARIDDIKVGELYKRTFKSTTYVISNLPMGIDQIRETCTKIQSLQNTLAYIITKEKEIVGRIVAELYEHPKEIILMQFYKAKNEKQTDRIIFFGEQNTKKTAPNSELTQQFYMYEFVSDHGIKYTLLSVKKLQVGNYIIYGNIIMNQDKTQLTETLRVDSRSPTILVAQSTPNIQNVKNFEEVSALRKSLQLSDKELFDGLFTIKDGDEKVFFYYPEWAKWLFWSWLLHTEQGKGTAYPLHIMLQGPAACGKSSLFTVLNEFADEREPIFSGSNSTLKALIPSFRERIPKPGYLLSCQRYAFVDEFFRCLKQPGNAPDFVQEVLANQNDMLEHKRSNFASGNGSIQNTKMTARVLYGTNPMREQKTMAGLLKGQDPSFLSRLLIVILEDDSDWVKKVKSMSSKEYEVQTVPINLNTLRSCVFYLKDCKSSFDKSKVQKIYDSVLPILSEDMLNHYTARHIHHLHCLMDGLVKARCLMQNNMDLIANEEDYENCRKVWSEILKTWISAPEIKKLDVSERLRYLPEKAQYMYRVLTRNNHILEPNVYKAKCTEEITHQEFSMFYVVLKEHELVNQTKDGRVATYKWFEEERMSEVL